VKKFGEIGNLISSAIEEYATEVKSRSFPAESHTYARQLPPKK
jgi:3-methyl-2-oxobutanoate hydroxymethyltransferase